MKKLLVLLALFICSCSEQKQATWQPAKAKYAANPKNIFGLEKLVSADIDASQSVRGLSDQQIHQLLLQIEQADQRYRDSLYNGNPANEKFYYRKMHANDQANLHLLEKIVEEKGWPDSVRFGGDGAAAAWLVVWHHRGNREIMKRYVNKMRPAFDAGTVSSAHYDSLSKRLRALDSLGL